MALSYLFGILSPVELRIQMIRIILWRSFDNFSNRKKFLRVLLFNT